MPEQRENQLPTKKFSDPHTNGHDDLEQSRSEAYLSVRISSIPRVSLPCIVKWLCCTKHSLIGELGSIAMGYRGSELSVNTSGKKYSSASSQSDPTIPHRRLTDWFSVHGFEGPHNRHVPGFPSSFGGVHEVIAK